MIEPLTFEDVAEDYPKVFQAGHPRCGFGVGRGWEALVRELCQGIEDLLPEEHEFSVQQVKEKFGGLRFYIFAHNLPVETMKGIHKLIDAAETRSYKECEVCGAPAEIDRGATRYGWLKALCPEHVEERSRGYGEDNTRRPPPTPYVEPK